MEPIRTLVPLGQGLAGTSVEFTREARFQLRFPVPGKRFRRFGLLEKTVSTVPVQFGERLRGKTIWGNRTKSLREENLPPRGSPRGPLKTSERYTSNED